MNFKIWDIMTASQTFTEPGNQPAHSTAPRTKKMGVGVLSTAVPGGEWRWTEKMETTARRGS
jgi:hypothetical protein